MCPWPRIQASLTDEHALNVTYRYDRGEPRGSVKKSTALREQGLASGDCVDCRQCVNVCPTGVDIRNGADLGCIQCGLCIDACDTVMMKVGRPTRLIAYDTDANITRRQAGEPVRYAPVRMRTALYAAVIFIVGGVMVTALATRSAEGISVIHDRNPMFVRLADGELRNAYTVHILNKAIERRQFILTVEGLNDVELKVTNPAVISRSERTVVVTVEPDQTYELRALVSSYQSLPPAASIPLTFWITDAKSRRRAYAIDHFRGP
jgi:cytochrome c oxidase accessory protein FixG